MMDSDERLYERARSGEAAAFDALYLRYERRLFGFIRAYLDDSAEAEDVLHESFIGLLRGRMLGGAPGSVRGWLYQVARNACLNRLRSRRRGLAAGARARAEPQPLGEDAAALLERREAGVALARAVGRLPTSLAELYHLRASGLSYEEMAGVLAVPLGTVKSRMHELLTQLKKEMRPWTAS